MTLSVLQGGVNANRVRKCVLTWWYAKNI